MTEQQRADFLRGGGFPLDTTPHLEAIAGTGVRFDRAGILREEGYTMLLSGRNHSDPPPETFDRCRRYMQVAGPSEDGTPEERAFDDWMREPNNSRSIWSGIWPTGWCATRTICRPPATGTSPGARLVPGRSGPPPGVSLAWRWPGAPPPRAHPPSRSRSALRSTVSTGTSVRFAQEMAAAVLAAAPLLIGFAIFSRQVIRGVVGTGAIKG